MSDKSVFKTLSEMNVNGRVEQKNGLSYLSWAWAWAEVCKLYPDAEFAVDHYEGKPYLYDSNLGYMVSTHVTINGKTLPMHLPVMDGANKAMKAESYSYKTKYAEKTVEAATMFDINKTVMRCLVKNLAMFGLGLYIYAGEDLPDVAPEPNPNLENVTEKHEKMISKWKSEGFTLQQCINSFESKFTLSTDIKQIIKETYEGV
jgi:hypothetical protein